MKLDKTLMIPPEGIPDAQRQDILRAYMANMHERRSHFVGFQTNQSGSFQEDLRPLLQMNLLNLGDNTEPGAYQVNSKAFELAVLDYYARLWNMPLSAWGYLTAMGSTEGNLFALWNAREYLCGAATAPTTPVVLYSDRGHYSLAKAAQLLQLPTPADIGPTLGRCPVNDGVWSPTVGCDAAGRVKVDELMRLTTFFYRHGRPVILCLTCGTTFSGACDDWPQITEHLRRLLPPNTEQQRHYWLHIDGALSANYLSFWPEPDGRHLAVHGKASALHSVCCSPYKWLGMSWPCGVVMLSEAFQVTARARPDYIGSRDATLSGSRPGLTAVVLWEMLSRLGEQGQQALIRHCFAVREYAHSQLQQLFARLDPMGVRLCLYPLVCGSLMVQFTAPSPAVIDYFSLSTEQRMWRGQPTQVCHLVLLPHCRRALIDELVRRLEQPGAFTSVGGQ
ncbi:pyridoxal-dependent decarboxylase [Musicola paradisiaca]|uniref:Pyridoxal-dependent decarboxylase n=1 Tax=Musicola paradisiaca (strain Ech703) TaxID=579405 RepID=C6C823_MUSP7|nr:pyridoxal-dependent decarboxylase [Musicola paradisiaca]ACS84168.1 Pyridoxal-dependent decarboxylase [Musicola paradisiaca Ech703]